jgi:hypothetical protein
MMVLFFKKNCQMIIGSASQVPRACLVDLIKQPELRIRHEVVPNVQLKTFPSPNSELKIG